MKQQQQYMIRMNTALQLETNTHSSLYVDHNNKYWLYEKRGTEPSTD